MDTVQDKVETFQAEQPQQVSQIALVCYFASLFSVVLSLVLWFLPADEEAKKARGERFAIFVGLWPPTLAIIGKVLEDRARAEGATR